MAEHISASPAVHTSTLHNRDIFREMLTPPRHLATRRGGAVHAGMHEVVVLPSTIAAAEAAEASGRPAWRVSSTLFAHIASSQVPSVRRHARVQA